MNHTVCSLWSPASLTQRSTSESHSLLHLPVTHSFLFLIRNPLCAWTPVCLSSDQLKNIWVASFGGSVLVNVLYGSWTNRMYVKKEIYYKEWLTQYGGQDLQGESAGLRPRKSQCWCSSLRAGKSQGLSSGAFGQKGFFFLSRRVSLFVLLMFSTDWMKPTCIRKSNLLYPVYQFCC